MKPDPCVALAEALAVGLTAQRTRPDQLVVSAQKGAAWPDKGNSFWLSFNQGLWYLSTWFPASYRVPANQDIVGLCSACMTTASSAMYRVPPDLVARFQLQEIDERQYERLFPTEGNEANEEALDSSFPSLTPATSPGVGLFSSRRWTRGWGLAVSNQGGAGNGAITRLFRFCGFESVVPDHDRSAIRV